MKQGDIFLVNFDPSVGREYKKIRPALILQHESSAKKSPYVTVMPMSSRIDNWNLPDILVPKDNKNRLMTNSLIKVQQISSFDKKRFIKKIGAVNSPVLRKVRGYLRQHFKL
ncbi:MAG: type II toxin-antitoxin system PemK/MazF family toxin [Patescibacteria group bacterium]|nr:type II toxin-antitoxin system PemK/MazF family toxin [Patescibacteria group bacterium]